MTDLMQLGEEELARYRRKFDAFDLNKDGIVELEELFKIGRLFGHNMRREDILEIFGKKDAETDRGVNFQEFVTALKKRSGMYKNMGDLKSKFYEYDASRRGFVTLDDVMPTLQNDLCLTEWKAENFFNHFDKNKDYRLTLFEFLPFQARVEQLKQEISEAFSLFDLDGDGVVSFAEATQVMVERGCPRQHAEKLFKAADLDRDGVLNYREFSVFWDPKIP